MKSRVSRIESSKKRKLIDFVLEFDTTDTADRHAIRGMIEYLKNFGLEFKTHVLLELNEMLKDAKSNIRIVSYPGTTAVECEFVQICRTF
jgi:hypothetical protein